MAKTLTPAEQDQAMLAFAEPGEDNRIVLRRTALEQAAFCPFMARQIRDGKTREGSMLSEIGEAVHQAKANTITWFIEMDGNPTPSAVAGELRSNLRYSRPDLQPKILDAAKASIWSWANVIARLHPGAIMAFDGGEELERPGEEGQTRTGQLSWEMSWGDDTVVVTAELDLLHSTASPDVLAEVDYKAGFDPKWDYDTVAQAFQFETHAFLVFNNFPDVQFLDARVWSTRYNQLTPRTRFRRDRMDDYNARVRSAVTEYMRWKDDPRPPATPYAEKCRICPCVLQCPHSHATASDVAKGPPGALQRLIVLNEAVKAQKAALWEHVEATGEDIVTEDGTAYGHGKPSADRKPTNPIYKRKVSDASESE